MIEFEKLELKDIEVIRPYLIKNNSRLCDSTIGGIFMWREYFRTGYTIQDDSLFFKVRYLYNKITFPIPIGPDIKGNIQRLKNYCATNNYPLILNTVSSENLELLKKHFEIENITSERNWFDYLYLSEDIISFKGKKYNGQRNHINKFKRLYPDYQFSEISYDNITTIKAFLDRIFENDDALSPTKQEERKKVYELIDNYTTYNLPGGILTVDGQVVAMSVGEIINDTLFVHIEKADRNYLGSYQMIVNEFAKHYATNVKYINREEDVGDEGLRTSKMSYHPIDLLEKNTVEVKI